MLTRRSTADDWAVVKTHSWDREHGEYVCTVETAVGDPGPHSDWEITGAAASSIAMLLWLDEVAAMRDEVAGDRIVVTNARDETVTARNTAMTKAGEAATARNQAVDAAAAAATFDPALYATKASPAFTGTPTAPTAEPGTDSNQLATTAFVAGAELSAAAHARRTAIRFSVAL